MRNAHWHAARGIMRMRSPSNTVCLMQASVAHRTRTIKRRYSVYQGSRVMSARFSISGNVVQCVCVCVL